MLIFGAKTLQVFREKLIIKDDSVVIEKGILHREEKDIKYKKIERIKNTKHMYALKDNEKREKNVEKAFKNSLNLENKNVLIVDDIVTSGATINSISEELRKDNENINIKVFSIAIARHFIME